jgi:hypothetical protein
MKDDLNEFLAQNKQYLPLLANYWVQTISKRQDDNKGEISLRVYSSLHNTTEYSCHTFYKIISTSINLTFYE